MHPVLPSTTVRGPAALAIIFMTRADSQPWHVRWPEVKNSSSGIFFTPLKGSNFWVGTSIKVAISSSSLKTLAADPRLFSQTNPLCQGLRLAFRSLINDVGHLLHVGHGHLAPAQTTDEVEHGWPLGRRIHRRANLRGQDAAEIRRAEGEVSVDDPHGGKAPERLGQFLGRKRPEPAHAHKADFHPFFAHLPDGN